MRIELWIKKNPDGTSEEDFAKYARNVAGDTIGIKLGGVWYQTPEEASMNGWNYAAYLDLNPAP